MDAFGVKYVKEEDKKHLLDSLNQHYRVTVDDKETQYLGITLEWYYKNWRVHLSMPGYVPKALKRFFHEPPPKIQYQPYPCAPPNYRAKVQYTKAINKPSPLSKGDKTFSMQVTGTIIFYARAIGITMLPTLIYIASKQNSPTENTIKRFKNPSIMPHPKMSQSSRSTLVVCY